MVLNWFPQFSDLIQMENSSARIFQKTRLVFNSPQLNTNYTLFLKIYFLLIIYYMLMILGMPKNLETFKYVFD